MNSSKLMTTIKSLSDKEIREFSKFLKSPYFNHDQHIVKLYAYIRRFHPFWESPKLEKERVFKKLFKGEPYVVRKMNDVMSDLYLKLEDYLVLKELEKHSTERDILLIRAFESKNLSNFFFNGIKKATTKLEKQSEKEIDFYYHQFVLGKEGYLHEDLSLFTRTGQKQERNFLQILLKNLDQFYFRTKLRFFKEVRVHERTAKLTYENPLMPEILKLIREDLSSHSFITRVYSSLFLLREEPSKDAYWELKKLIFENIALIPREELHELTSSLIHYNNSKMKSESETLVFAKEIFAISKFQLAHDLMVFEGIIAPGVFLNTVSIATGLMEIEWAERFINDFSEYLSDKERDNARGIAIAKLHYSKGAYDVAIQELNLITHKQIHYSVNARVLEIQCYFMQNDIDRTSTTCDRFTRYLNRKKEFSGKFKVELLNFISFMRKLIRVNRPTKEVLLKQLAETKDIISKAWLQKTITDFKK